MTRGKGKKSKMWNFLTPEHFEDVVLSSIKCTYPNTDDMEDLKAPSNAIKLIDLLTLNGLFYLRFVDRLKREKHVRLSFAS